MYGYGYGSAIDSLGVNRVPMCDFQTWYQNYYPLYAQMYGAQANVATGATTLPNFKGISATEAQAQAQPNQETQTKGNGGKAAAVISAAALIGSGIACYRKGNAMGAKTFLEKLTKGFNTYKNKGLAKIYTHKYANKGIVDTLPENATIRTGTFKHNAGGGSTNLFTFENNRIVGYKNAAGEDLLGKFNNPTAEGDIAYAETIKKALADITQGKTVEGFEVTPRSYISNNEGKKQIYNLITEGENEGKYRLRERTRKWFWQS